MLTDTFLVALVATVVQLVVKPLITRYWLPPSSALQNTATRGAVYVVAYGAVLANTAAHQALTWPLAWGILPTVGAIGSAAIAGYAILTDNSGSAGTGAGAVIVPPGVQPDGGHVPPVELAAPTGPQQAL